MNFGDIIVLSLFLKIELEKGNIFVFILNCEFWRVEKENFSNIPKFQWALVNSSNWVRLLIKSIYFKFLKFLTENSKTVVINYKKISCIFKKIIFEFTNMNILLFIKITGIVDFHSLEGSIHINWIFMIPENLKKILSKNLQFNLSSIYQVIDMNYGAFLVVSQNSIFNSRIHNHMR